LTDWQDIGQAQFVREHTVADLKMKSGRVYRAHWKEFGVETAWWPESGQARKKPIGLYDPVAFRVVAAGMGTSN